MTNIEVCLYHIPLSLKNFVPDSFLKNFNFFVITNQYQIVGLTDHLDSTFVRCLKTGKCFYLKHEAVESVMSDLVQYPFNNDILSKTEFFRVNSAIKMLWEEAEELYHAHQNDELDRLFLTDIHNDDSPLIA